MYYDSTEVWEEMNYIVENPLTIYNTAYFYANKKVMIKV